MAKKLKEKKVFDLENVLKSGISVIDNIETESYGAKRQKASQADKDFVFGQVLKALDKALKKQERNPEKQEVKVDLIENWNLKWFFDLTLKNKYNRAAVSILEKTNFIETVYLEYAYLEYAYKNNATDINIEVVLNEINNNIDTNSKNKKTGHELKALAATKLEEVFLKHQTLKKSKSFKIEEKQTNVRSNKKQKSSSRKDIQKNVDQNLEM